MAKVGMQPFVKTAQGMLEMEPARRCHKGLVALAAIPGPTDKKH